MCGRYLIDEDDEVLAALPGKKGEICPGDNACVFVRENRITPVTKTWGFVRANTTRMLINARSETAADRPTFSGLMTRKRVLVPATAYFEYDKNKVKHMLGIPDKRVYMAGLYDEDRYVILTREASPGIRGIHDRMPVLFSHDSALKWLDRQSNPCDILYEALQAEVF